MSKDLLKSLVGSWEGTCRTWFEPDKVADESQVSGTFSPVLDGRFVRHEYESTMQGSPRHGEELIAFNSVTEKFETSWVDDFHMNYAILYSVGPRSDGGFVVTGKFYFDPNEAPGGWKTAFDLTDDDHLTITAYYIGPDGEEAKAVETTYSRTKS